MPISRFETIDAYAAEPWNERVEVITDQSERAIELASGQRASASLLAAQPRMTWSGLEWLYGFRILEGKDQIHVTLFQGLRKTPHYVRQRVVLVFTSNKGAALSLKRPWHQSGQKEIANLYACVAQLRKRSTKVVIVWRPQEQKENTGDENVDNGTSDNNSNGNSTLARLTKEAARKAALPGSSPRISPFRAKSTALNNARKTQSRHPVLPDNVGAFSKRIDIPFTRTTYSTDLRYIVMERR
ncbi:hypothetical protein TruAng_011832 [Truncatella angustata]|nr:hypothetical protein TruAng_011832 [Truncatella angustata]